ncbi:hypothetical protein REPUB_Repub11eG0085600 [Reevesia pubescens]
MDANLETGGWCYFLHIRVDLNIVKPIRRTKLLNSVQRRESWARLKYERMPIFCYHCGVISHSHSDYESKSQAISDNPIGFQYGDWLHASPFKMRHFSGGVTKFPDEPVHTARFEVAAAHAATITEDHRDDSNVEGRDKVVRNLNLGGFSEEGNLKSKGTREIATHNEMHGIELHDENYVGPGTKHAVCHGLALVPP